MKTRLLIGSSMAFLVFAWLGGCKTATEPIEDKYTVFQEMIAGDTFFSNDAAILGSDGQLPAQTLGKTAAPIIPVAWGRQITSASRNVEFQDFSDTLVVATITHSLSGNVLIAAKDSLLDTTITVVSKPFSESLVRIAKFYRIARTDRIRDNWRIREISGVKGGTTNSLLTIDQLQAIIGADTITVSDPNAFFRRLPAFGGQQIPTIGANATVTILVTVTSTEPDTDFVMLYRPFHWINSSVLRPHHARMQLVSQTGSGPYTRVYEYTWTSQVMGRHHFFVSGITRNSLFDDVAPWATQLWGIPYRVQ